MKITASRHTLPYRTKRPTKRQAQVLAVIKQYVKEHGKPPAIHKLSAACGFSSTVGSVCHVTALVKKGYLSKDGKGKIILKRLQP